MRRLPWAEIVVTALAIGAGAGVYAWAHRDSPRLAETKVLGTEVVAALEAYRSDEGTYPASLDDLAPEYLAAVPDPVWGLGRWSYQRYSPSRADSARDAAANVVYFSLAVAASESGYPVLYYDVTVGGWVLNN